MSVTAFEVHDILRELNSAVRECRFVRGIQRKRYDFTFEETLDITLAITERIWHTPDSTAEQARLLGILKTLSPMTHAGVERTLAHRREALDREALCVPELEVHL